MMLKSFSLFSSLSHPFSPFTQHKYSIEEKQGKQNKWSNNCTCWTSTSSQNEKKKLAENTNFPSTLSLLPTVNIYVIYQPVCMHEKMTRREQEEMWRIKKLGKWISKVMNFSLPERERESSQLHSSEIEKQLNFHQSNFGIRYLLLARGGWTMKLQWKQNFFLLSIPHFSLSISLMMVESRRQQLWW